MSDVHITLFGKLQVRDCERGTIHIEPQRCQELLSYLLLYRDCAHEREKLAALMWGDTCTTQAKRYLRQTLWQLQCALGHDDLPADALLAVDHEHIGINQHANYWLDIAVFEQVYAAVEKKSGAELSTHELEMLRNAVTFYHGHLLEGWYTDWCIYERERYESIYLAMLEKLLCYSEAQCLYADGVAFGLQILRYDRAREQTHRQLMRLHFLSGDRTAALHQYDACVKALDEELGVTPASSTIALCQQIRNEQVSLLDPPAPRDLATHALALDKELCTLRQLEHIQASLALLQAEVTQLVQSVSQRSLHQP